MFSLYKQKAYYLSKNSRVYCLFITCKSKMNDNSTNDGREKLGAYCFKVFTHVKQYNII